jgi:hypothetical protein
MSGEDSKMKEDLKQWVTQRLAILNQYQVLTNYH